jgi:hypothetical protein
MVDELFEKIDKLEETLGPEYVALIDGLQDIDTEKTSSARRSFRYWHHSTGCVRGKSPKT